MFGSGRRHLHLRSYTCQLGSWICWILYSVLNIFTSLLAYTSLLILWSIVHPFSYHVYDHIGLAPPGQPHGFTACSKTTDPALLLTELGIVSRGPSSIRSIAPFVS